MTVVEFLGNGKEVHLALLAGVGAAIILGFNVPFVAGIPALLSAAIGFWLARDSTAFCGLTDFSLSDDREIARRSLDLRARSRDICVGDLPGFVTWSNRKLAEGESAALIVHLGATSVCLLPEAAAKMTENDYDEMLDDLKQELD